MSERVNPKRTVPKWTLYGLIVSYVTVFVMALSVVLYANWVNQESDQKWCGLVSSLDDAYSSQTPTTDLGKKIAREIHNLRNDFEC